MVRNGVRSAGAVCDVSLAYARDGWRLHETGGSYTVDSASLALALLAGPSAAGGWCGVVGVGDFGVEAAQALGVDLDRTVLVPDPGDQWLEVVVPVQIMALALVFSSTNELNYPVLVSVGAMRDVLVRGLIAWPISALIIATASMFGLIPPLCNCNERARRDSTGSVVCWPEHADLPRYSQARTGPHCRRRRRRPPPRHGGRAQVRRHLCALLV